MLFLKQQSSANSFSAHPSKKIILSRLEPLPAEQIEIPKKVANIAYATNIPVEKSSVIDAPIAKNIDRETTLDIALVDDKIPLDLETSNKEEPETAPARIIAQDASPDQDVSAVAKKVIYAPATPKKTGKPQNLLVAEAIPQQETQQASTSTDVEPKLIVAQNGEKQPSPLLSKNQEMDEIDTSIPLEKSSSPLFAKAEIKSTQMLDNSSVALNSANVPIKSIKTGNAVKSQAPRKDDNNKAWQQMKDKEPKVPTEAGDPWVVATRRGASINQLLPEKKDNLKIKETLNQRDKLSKEDQQIQLAAETVDNLLIPIPEEILKEENITPQLVSSPENAEIKKELEAKGLIKEPQKTSETASNQSSDTPSTEEKSDNSADEKGGILKSLTSIFSSDESLPEIGNEVSDDVDTSLFSAFSRKKDKIITKILPTEIRLSFQTNRAEISGQTLKWIKAFAQKTAEEPSVGLEIRIDGTSSPLLQRRRLNLLQNILLSEGAPAEKIKTTFTAREPNSFILRTVKFNVKNTNSQTQNKNKYIQW